MICSQDDGEGLLQETVRPKAKLPPLLCKLTERSSEKLDYIGVSYGLTKGLLKFWKKAGYLPVYLRQVQVCVHTLNDNIASYIVL